MELGVVNMGCTGNRQIALIADDDEFFRMALGKMLKNDLGFDDVVEAKSFDEALDYLNGSGPIALALFDLDMPGIDSPSLLRSIRDTFGVPKIAVVSGSKLKLDILLALEAGVHGYIPKWLGVRELKRALEIVIEGTVYVPSSLPDLFDKISISDENASGMQDGGPLPVLTSRQRQVLIMVMDGKSTKEIARSLNLGLGTVKVHLSGLFRTLGVANRSAAAAAGVHLIQRRSSDVQTPKTIN